VSDRLPAFTVSSKTRRDAARGEVEDYRLREHRAHSFFYMTVYRFIINTAIFQNKNSQF